MKNQLTQHTATEHDTSVLDDGVLSVNTFTQSLHVHNGVDPGGTALGVPVRLQGPTEVIQGNQITYTILDYDTFSKYDANAVAGTVSIDGSTITYTAPGSGETDTLTVKRNGVGRTFLVALLLPQISGVYTEMNGGATRRLYHTAVATNSLMYVCGGYGPGGLGDLVDLWSYNPTSDTWDELTGPPRTIQKNAIGHINGKLYFAAGELADGSDTSELLVYDINGDSWEQKKALPNVVEFMRGAVVNDKLYVFGGYDTSQSSSVAHPNVYEYNPITDQWTAKAALFAGRNNHTFTAVGDKIYLHGGYGDGTYYKDLWEYDPATDSWTERKPGPRPRRYHGAASVNDKLYIFCGRGESAGDFSWRSDLWEYDPATDTWTELLSWTYGSGNMTLVGLNGKLYKFGGYEVDLETNSTDENNRLWQIS